MGLVDIHQIQMTAAAQPLRSGRLELGGQLGREEEGERRCSKRVNGALKTGWDWGSADETGCSAPSERSPETNPPSPPLPPLRLPPPVSSLPGLPH